MGNLAGCLKNNLTDRIHGITFHPKSALN
jgi:hypothetical protein